MTGRFDPRARSMEAPQSGWWLVRLGGIGSPWVPAAIEWRETWSEPGNLENVMDRGPRFFAFVSGEEVAVDEVWLRRGRPISRREYEQALRSIERARLEERYDPRLSPREKVDVERLPLPF